MVCFTVNRKLRIEIGGQFWKGIIFEGKRQNTNTEVRMTEVISCMGMSLEEEQKRLSKQPRGVCKGNV